MAPSSSRKAASADARKKDKSKSQTPSQTSAEKFNKELKDLASKAQNDTWLNNALRQVRQLIGAALVLALAAIYANVSQLMLSPVYGSIPSHAWHSHVVMAGAFVGWAGNLAIQKVAPFKTSRLLPILALFTPPIQFFLEKYTERFGGVWGPVTVESLTVFPLVAISAATVADVLDGVKVPLLPTFLADAVPGMGSWLCFKMVEGASSTYLNSVIGTALVFTRMGLQLALGGIYAVLAPSVYLLLTVPALIHTAMYNTHVQLPQATDMLRTELLRHNWMLLDRHDSTTGYVSVLDNLKDGYRVMRCDHSLLGGEYTGDRGGAIAEPIYGVFAMLEAVRLVETPQPVPDSDAKALVVGLGIGTTPSALVAHGINTTVVEIDAAVHRFAKKYFDLRENNDAVIEDATVYTKQLASTDDRFDYIVHDVFTGGAEPISLFTLEFLGQLHTLLKPRGSIAINYAGDLLLPGPRTIVRTIKNVFPTCRIFREYPPDKNMIAKTGSDFTNVVIFCKKESGSLSFRDANAADMLGTYARQEFLQPKYEVEAEDFLASPDEVGILRANDTDVVRRSHKSSALGHWKIMRTVLPAVVWEKW